jgi:Asp-tRNA(Asn)/Glu-tRNA(Gln) amidotransferase B subunit
MATQTIISTRLLVGMEIHVELATESKMFTSAPNGAVQADTTKNQTR